MKNGLYRWIVLVSFIFVMVFSNACRGVDMKHNGKQAAVQNTETVEKLPEPSTEGNVSIEETLMRRMSARNFTAEKLTYQQISQLLWAAQGVNRTGTRFRTAPSAGATYPLETYAVTPDGVFRYIPGQHSMVLTREGDHRRELAGAALGQGSVSGAPLSIVFTAIYERTTNRYGERGVMYVHMEAGHAAQNVHLQAVALGLGSVPIGAFEPEKVRDVIRTGAHEVPIYIIPVGYPANR
jgi:SagB-type dehydrogenase family enzyme